MLQAYDILPVRTNLILSFSLLPSCRSVGWLVEPHGNNGITIPISLNILLWTDNSAGQKSGPGPTRPP